MVVACGSPSQPSVDLMALSAADSPSMMGADGGAQAASGLVADAPSAAPAQPRVPTGGDDLTMIEGVGPKIADVLRSSGIASFTMLSVTSADRIRELLAEEGGSFANHDPTTWPDQAQMAANGEWDKLRAWQDVLVGGRDASADAAAPAVDAQPVAAEPAEPVAPADDLTKIEGIGPKIGEALGNSGVTSFAKMASMTSQDIKDILTNSDGTFGNHDSTTWPQQAAMAAEGKWDELNAWQDELDGGKIVAPAAEPEDLTKIEGIGPKVAELLNASGITTFKQLSEASPESIKQILDGAGGVMATMDPTTWPQQSQMAVDGKWDELQKWQDELDGGRVVEAAEPDDLTKVEGIGPAVAELLGGSDIKTFAKLAETTPDAIKEILAAAGGVMTTMDPTTWPDQAKLAAAGDWEKLQAWQDELDGGVA